MPSTFALFRAPRLTWCSAPVLALALTLLMGAPALRAQSSDGANADKQTIQALLHRVEELEARVARLEATHQTVSAANSTEQQPPAAPAAPQAPSTIDTEADARSAHAAMERMDTSSTLLRIRGFGDVNLRGGDQKGTTTSFALGQLNLFVTSDVSEKFKLLSEIVFEADQQNNFGVD